MSLKISKSFNTWNILIVDDIPDVHKMLKLAFRKYRYLNKPLSFTSAYSAREAIKKLDQTSFCLILLDVVVESKKAGLDLVRYIRETQRDDLTRIVLITEHPGDVPTEQVITDYEIDDFVEKDEMLNRTLFTSITTCLRTYNALKRVQEGEKIQKRLKAFAGNFALYSSTEDLAKAIFDVLVESELIKHPAVFFNDSLKYYKTGRSLLIDMFEKWDAGGRSARFLNDFFFHSSGQINDYTFVARCESETAKQHTKAIFDQASVMVSNFRKLVSSDIFSKIYNLGRLLESIISLKADGRDILVDIGLRKPVRINLPISDISLFFEESFIARVHRSYSVNPNKIIKFVVKERSRALDMSNGETIPVGSTYYKAFDRLKELFLS